MKKICVISEGNPAVDPRPHRVVNLLRKHYLVTIIGRGIEGLILDGIEVLSYDIPLKRTAEQEEELERNVAKKDYLKLVQIPTRMKIIEHLNKCEFDIIFCHDLVLLPFVLEAKKNAKVIFDAREYYPREMENNERWRRLFADFNDWLCKTYLPQADIVYTVCNGLAEEYSKNYGITCGVITSAAKYYAPPPKGLSSHETIKLIYHGMAGR
ncbi:hypothetical protein CCZ01_09840, partial [Helicobacter monodelphidis]|uniref:glycosyltransferase n=1 Tax=Helicobacter sp. 15-1451 TaxID=2004995 RepID=UPI000DCD37A1